MCEVGGVPDSLKFTAIMIYLDDLISQPNFNQALEASLPKFTYEFALPKIDQLGMAVADVEAAARILEDQGVPPFFIVSGSPASWIERGEAGSYQGKMGVSHYQGLELELLEPGQGSTVFLDSLDPKGRIVVHHLAYRVADVQPWVQRFAAAGYSIWIQGTNQIGPARSQFTYMDTRREMGLAIEFFSRTCWGLNWWPLSRLYRIMARIQKMTGKRGFSV